MWIVLLSGQSTQAFQAKPSRGRRAAITQPHMSTSTPTSSTTDSSKKGKLLVLGGTGFLGQTVCKRAVLEGYKVTSLSRRGTTTESSRTIDYRQGDARKSDTVANILAEGGYTGVIHCIGLLLDDASGLGDYNRFVSGSASVPDKEATYDTITRLTARYAIEAAVQYATDQNLSYRMPFCFVSAAEAGWPDVPGGKLVEEYLAPDWLKRYLKAKRAVEQQLFDSTGTLRPVVVRPSLIYSLDRPASYVPVGAFFVGNTVGLPFVDKPVTVQALSCAMVRSMDPASSTEGVLRYPEIEELSQ